MPALLHVTVVERLRLGTGPHGWIKIAGLQKQAITTFLLVNQWRPESNSGIGYAGREETI